MDLLMQNRECLDLGKYVKGLRLTCRAGRCWLTQAGDSRDIILDPGDEFAAITNGRLIITAVAPSRLTLSERATKSPGQRTRFMHRLIHGPSPGVS